eukprot:sb/3474935/
MSENKLSKCVESTLLTLGCRRRKYTLMSAFSTLLLLRTACIVSVDTNRRRNGAEFTSHLSLGVLGHRGVRLKSLCNSPIQTHQNYSVFGYHEIRDILGNLISFTLLRTTAIIACTRGHMDIKQNNTNIRNV